MSRLSDAIKETKERDLKWFFGDVKRISNKYFTFNHVIDDDNIIIITANIVVIKDNYAMLVGNNKGVFLKDWQVRKVHNYDFGIDAYAVKLNRRYFRVYTFDKIEFEDFAFEKDEDFDMLKADAATQTMPVALGHMG